MSNVGIMRLSIIIPTHNYGQYLERALQSVLPQAGEDTEIIVVDDGSTDNTAALMQSYVSRCPRLRYLNQPQSGPGTARNNGARDAQGEWLMFLDADDYLHPEALPVLFRAMDERPDVDAIAGGFYVQDRKGRQRRVNGPSPSSSTVENFAAFLEDRMPINPGSFVVRRQAFQALDGYPVDIYLSEDKVMWGKLFANCPVAGVPDPIVHMCAHPGRLRDHHDRRHREALRYVDQLFDPKHMPPECQPLKNRAYAKAQLELEQSLYRRKQFPEAIRYFHQALRTSWHQALRFKYLRYYFVSLLGLALNATVGRALPSRKHPAG